MTLAKIATCEEQKKKKTHFSLDYRRVSLRETEGIDQVLACVLEILDEQKILIKKLANHEINLVCDPMNGKACGGEHRCIKILVIQHQRESLNLDKNECKRRKDANEMNSLIQNQERRKLIRNKNRNQ